MAKLRLVCASLTGVGVICGLLLSLGSVRAAGSDHVRWDIVDFISFSPNTFRAGGAAFATATNPSTLSIKLTGSGTFVAPANGGASGAVTGGGTWETFNSGVSTGSGNYVVTGLASWEFAAFFAPGPPPFDLVGNLSQAASGNVVLRIRYSDGSEGTLGVGCHGPGAPDGIVEGVIATKGYVTYWSANPPLPDENLNRTVFHITK